MEESPFLDESSRAWNEISDDVPDGMTVLEFEAVGSCKLCGNPALTSAGLVSCAGEQPAGVRGESRQVRRTVREDPNQATQKRLLSNVQPRADLDILLNHYSPQASQTWWAIV